ncbi:MAG: hypothetical protein ABIC04_06630 [Nanoarchaeota archaeon]
MQDENIAIYEQRIACSISTLADKVGCLVNTSVEKAKVAFRVKNPETLRKKIFLKKAKDVFSIHDVYGIRVIVETVDEAYMVLTKISEMFPMRLANDFIKDPVELFDPGFEGKFFKCLRLIAYENNIPFEIQVTTSSFHEVNESHHEIYHQKIYHS